MESTNWQKKDNEFSLEDQQGWNEKNEEKGKGIYKGKYAQKTKQRPRPEVEPIELHHVSMH